MHWHLVRGRILLCLHEYMPEKQQGRHTEMSEVINLRHVFDTRAPNQEQMNGKGAIIEKPNMQDGLTAFFLFLCAFIMFYTLRGRRNTVM